MPEVTRGDIGEWVIQALNSLDGSAHYIRIAKVIWENHESELRGSGDRFYTWQYDMRWASQMLRNKGVLEKANTSGLPKGVWKLTSTKRAS